MKWWYWKPRYVFECCFKPAFFTLLFHIQRLFSSSLFSAIRVVSSAHLRLLIFLPAVLIPACASSSLAFHMIYSACQLNKQGDNIQPWCTPFPVWKQSVVPCPVLIVASWPPYRFFRREIRSDIPISLTVFHSFLWSTQWASVVAQLVKNLPAIQETWVQFLGWEDPLEKGKATHSSELNTTEWLSHSQKLWHNQ